MKIVATTFELFLMPDIHNKASPEGKKKMDANTINGTLKNHLVSGMEVFIIIGYIKVDDFGNLVETSQFI